MALNFAILAFIIFLMIKQINRLKREEPAAPVVVPDGLVGLPAEKLDMGSGGGAQALQFGAHANDLEGAAHTGVGPHGQVDEQADVDGALAATVFHSGEIPIPELKTMLAEAGVAVRA